MSVILIRGDSPQTAPQAMALNPAFGMGWSEDLSAALRFARDEDAAAFAKVYLKATPCRTAPFHP